MAELRISRVDPADHAALVAWWEVFPAAYLHDLGRHATYWRLEEQRVLLRSRRKHLDSELYAAHLDGEVVAAAQLDYRLLDNTTAVEIELVVRPEHRRRGHGSALLAYAERAAADRGRTRFDAMSSWPYGGAPDGRGEAGIEFALRHGYTFGLGDVQREVTLPVDDALLVELAGEAAPHTAGYEIRAWAGPIPEDLIASSVALSSRINTEAPMGDLQLEDETVDLEAVRIGEQVQLDAGRTIFHAVALAPDGSVVAQSDIGLSSYDDDWAYQWITIVDPDHRGHRLGMAVKVANLRQLQDDGRAAGRRLVTWNAEENAHMIGINRRLGFEPTGRGAELQKLR